ncbi:MAG: bifunctional nicotinamidase/pyrazinamidase [Enterobacteriaceae bacterium]
MNNTALLLVDLQNDFCSGGALAVRGGDEVIDIANQAIDLFVQQQSPVIASLDWHPHNHLSFAANSGTRIGDMGILNGLPQVWWPAHCVQGSAGAEFHPELNVKAIEKVIYKGEDPNIDSYSVFFDNDHKKATELHDWLQQSKIRRLWVMGLATDYCVKYSVLDALDLGYEVWVLVDGCRAVNQQAEDGDNALKEMISRGARLLSLNAAISDQAAKLS